jgi:hypothetical protein
LFVTANSGSNNVSVFAPAGHFEIGKTAPGQVHPGGTVSYSLTVHNPADHPVVGRVSDNLSGVLDKATFQGEPHASTGSVAFHTPFLGWHGTLAPGDTAKITYSVRVHDGLHGGELFNEVTGPPGSTCTGLEPAEPCVRVTRIVPPPAPGPRLHRHAYDETWVIQEGSINFRGSGDDWR